MELLAALNRISSESCDSSMSRVSVDTMNLMPSSLSDGYCQIAARRLDRLRSALDKALKGGSQFDPPLAPKFAAAWGLQKIQRWNTEDIFRLLQSIPSPKAEPFSGFARAVSRSAASGDFGHQS